MCHYVKLVKKSKFHNSVISQNSGLNCYHKLSTQSDNSGSHDSNTNNIAMHSTHALTTALTTFHMNTNYFQYHYLIVILRMSSNAPQFSKEVSNKSSNFSLQDLSSALSSILIHLKLLIRTSIDIKD